jgi:hypothetical protein
MRRNDYSEGEDMLRKFWFVAALMLLPTAAANAQFSPGDWELTLSGEGRHGPDLNGTDFGVNFTLGYFLTKELEVGVRQSVNYADDTGPGSAWDGTTGVALDYHFDLGRWQPFIGANFGFRYGDVHNTFEAGPEGGVKYFVNATTFVQLGVQYEFFFDKDSRAGSAFSDGQFVYALGVGFKWH